LAIKTIVSDWAFAMTCERATRGLFPTLVKSLGPHAGHIRFRRALPSIQRETHSGSSGGALAAVAGAYGVGRHLSHGPVCASL